MFSENNSSQPPSYDVAVGGASYPALNQGGYQLTTTTTGNPMTPQPRPSDVKKAPHNPKGQPFMPSPQSYPTMLSGSSSQSPTVYHYQNPRTRQVVTSLLPPNHPAMLCLQAGEHVKKTRYGVVGILVAVFWFPLGIGLCLLDRKTKCVRCGEVLHDGLICE